MRSSTRQSRLLNRCPCPSSLRRTFHSKSCSASLIRAQMEAAGPALATLRPFPTLSCRSRPHRQGPHSSPRRPACCYLWRVGAAHPASAFADRREVAVVYQQVRFRFMVTIDSADSCTETVNSIRSGPPSDSYWNDLKRTQYRSGLSTSATSKPVPTSGAESASS